MHPDFPADPYTLTVGAISLLAVVFGWLGGGPLWALILGLLVAVPLLLLEWIGFLVYERLIASRRTEGGARGAG